MIQKIEKLIDVAIEALTEVRDYYANARGATLPMPALIASAPAAAPAPTRGRPRKEKPAPLAPVEEPSPFGGQIDEQEQPAGKPAAAAAAASIEDQAEAKRRCTEVMGLFIRRYLKSQPTGLDRAKKILADTLGRSIAKLEDLTYDDNVKLIPVFEAELEKAAVLK